MNSESEELYDLGKDISEKNQLVHDADREALFNAKEVWSQQLIDPIFLGLMQDEEYNELNLDRWEYKKFMKFLHNHKIQLSMVPKSTDGNETRFSNDS